MEDAPHRGMKAKTIKAVLAKKHRAWVESIEDLPLQKLAQRDTIITGGSIASMLLGEKINDFDLYFTNLDTAYAIAQYYVARFQVKNRSGIPCSIAVSKLADRVKVNIKSSGIASEDGAEAPYEYFESSPEDRAAGYVGEVMSDAGDATDVYEETEALAQDNEDPTFRPVFMSTNAISLSNRVQLVLRFAGDAEEIHRNYDFVHCTNYWTSGDNRLVLRKEALESLLSRELRYVGSKYPLCSIIRLRKFIKRGWVINAGQILKMAMQLNEMDLTDPLVLQDQLTGVDSAYFIELIRKVKEKDPDKINSAYLIEIVDRMF